MKSIPYTSNSLTKLEYVLDLKLMNFCSHHHNEPAIRDFNNNEDNSDPELPVSNEFSKIEKEFALKKFI